MSCGKYLLFLNPDTVLIEPIFDFAVKTFETNPELAMFGVQLVDRSRNRIFSFGMADMYSLLAAFINRQRLKRNRFVDKQMFISGADMFIRRDVFEQAGQFDSKIFMYHEESDLIRRIKMYASVKKIAFFPNKQIIHLCGGTENIFGGEKIIKEAQRSNTSERYYALKYNIDYKRILKYRIKVSRIKAMINTLRRRKEHADAYKALISYYKAEMKNYLQS